MTASLLALGAAIGPASSEAAFTAPFTLSPAGQNTEVAQVASDADGDALVVWQNVSTGKIQARARSSAGTLGPVQTLSTASDLTYASDPQVAIDADGDALITWSRFDGTGDFCCDRVQARTRSSTGTLGPIQTLSAAGFNSYRPQVASDAGGDALVVWHRSDDRIQARARSAGGTLGPVQLLVAAPPGEDPSIPQVAMDTDGDALVVWQRFLDGVTFRIQAIARSSAGTLGPVQTVSTAGQAAYRPQVAMDAGGNSVAVWAGYDATTQCSGSHCLRIQARARPAAGGFAAVQMLSPAGLNADAPEVAMDADRDALAVWQESTGIESRARSAAGTLGAVQTLSTGGREFPEVAMDSDGDAVAVWAADTAGGSCCDRIEARTRSAAGTLGAVKTISATSGGSGAKAAGRPQVAVDAVGHALAVWERLDGTNRRIGAAAGP